MEEVLPLLVGYRIELIRLVLDGALHVVAPLAGIVRLATDALLVDDDAVAESTVIHRVNSAGFGRKIIRNQMDAYYPAVTNFPSGMTARRPTL